MRWSATLLRRLAPLDGCGAQRLPVNPAGRAFASSTEEPAAPSVSSSSSPEEGTSPAAEEAAGLDRATGPEDQHSPSVPTGQDTLEAGRPSGPPEGREPDQQSASQPSRPGPESAPLQGPRRAVYKGFKPHKEGRDPTYDRFPIECEGMCRSATQRDIARAFAHIGVTPRQCRVQLDDFFQPVKWYVTFPTKAQQVEALRGGPYPMGARRMYVHMTNMFVQNHDTYHPFAQHSRGRFVFVTDIQENATMTDLKRFVEGYPVMESGLTFMRVTAPRKLDLDAPSTKVPLHRAVIRFLTPEIAARAIRDLHGMYLLNTPVVMRSIM